MNYREEKNQGILQACLICRWSKPQSRLINGCFSAAKLEGGRIQEGTKICGYKRGKLSYADSREDFYGAPMDRTSKRAKTKEPTKGFYQVRCPS